MNEIDDIELPEFTDEILNEFKPLQNVDLHLGPAEVKKVDKDWFVKKYGPKPPGPGILALDILIIGLFLLCLDLFVLSWIHAFA